MKIILTTVLLFTLAFILNAQEKKISGEWLMYEAVQPGKTVEPYIILDFTNKGTIQIFGIDFGFWKYLPGNNILELKSEMEPDFNGDADILRFDNDTLIIKFDTVKFSFAKLNYENLWQQNKLSKLQGLWKLYGYENYYMKFNEPDNFLTVNNNDGSITTYRGQWFFNPKDSLLLVISFLRELKGKSLLKNFTRDEFTIINSGKKFIGKKVDTNKFHIDRLTFTEDSFDENADYRDKLPWNDFDLMKQRLADIKQLVYSSGFLIEDLNVLFYHTILQFIDVDENKGKVCFVNKRVVGRDTIQFSEVYHDHLSNRYNLFFPEDDPIFYRVIGKDTINVPAGKFECTVVEALEGNKKLKYWMVNQMPGVYAKIISEEKDAQGQISYKQNELIKIIR